MNENETKEQEMNGIVGHDGPNYAEACVEEDDKKYEIEQPKVWVSFGNLFGFLIQLIQNLNFKRML